MQLMPRTAAIYRVVRSDLYNPQKNLEAGIQYLKDLSDRFSWNVQLMLAAYNSGEFAVARYRGVPPYSRHFVHKVLQNYSANKIAEALPGGGEIGLQNKGK